MDQVTLNDMKRTVNEAEQLQRVIKRLEVAIQQIDSARLIMLDKQEKRCFFLKEAPPKFAAKCTCERGTEQDSCKVRCNQDVDDISGYLYFDLWTEVNLSELHEDDIITICNVVRKLEDRLGEVKAQYSELEKP